VKVRLGEVGKIVTGNTPPTSNGEYYASRDICFIKPSDIPDDGILHITETEFYISESARQKARILPKNSVVVTCIGIIGKVGITDVECALNQQSNAIIVETDMALPEYVAYAILQKKRQLQEKANAAVVPIINKSQFSDVEIDLPDIATQQRIVTHLNHFCDILELRRQQLQKLDELVKARFVEMFGTVHNNVYGFDIGTLDSVSDELFAGGDKPDDCILEKDATHRYPVFANGYENEGLQGYSVTCRVTKPAVTVSARGTIGYCFIRNAGFTPVVRLITIVPNNKVSSLFLKYAIDTMDINSSGTSQAQLTVPNFKRERIIVPPMEPQERFTAFVSQVYKSKAAIQSSLAQLETLKQSLMQEYYG